ncbi:MAG: HAMP domain-containing histidine kinase [Lachnospiraceae bacterium]|nr:HAMP domain-containing histidine kinase [Lachnospiraceae bacterium]
MNKANFVSPSVEKETIESLSQKLLEANQQLSETNKELKRIQQEREEMLSNISHDLRAPITAIRSSVDYIQSLVAPGTDDYRNSIALIDRRTKTLENLIQDMYYLFCVEDHSRELQLTSLDAASFLEEYFYDLLSDKCFDTHDMQLVLPKNLNCRICVDVQKFVRVLDNLFTNAEKYTPADSRIVLSAEIDPIASLLVVSVTDNGPGIPAGDLSHIFNRTYTVSEARTPGSRTGSGLGLAIAKTIMERHNGSIMCSNVQTGGCCFTLQLPCLIH